MVAAKSSKSGTDRSQCSRQLLRLQEIFLFVSLLLYQWSLFEQQLYGSVDRSGKSLTVYLLLVLLLGCMSPKN